MMDVHGRRNRHSRWRSSAIEHSLQVLAFRSWQETVPNTLLLYLTYTLFEIECLNHVAAEVAWKGRASHHYSALRVSRSRSRSRKYKGKEGLSR
jgi:nicotinic acid phosphoribosyltransferase